ncbi:hypothetical protein [Microbacterium sp. No. 7]|uniref:hypothetical protein n=1 Tax=Microbacterium sp. No. 7 TaxID=1714373 RepID=UPI0006D28EB9|nr:hypothetical protein [Microbacterium sp. No. 7]ALJ21651.1 hypothetical protein AOA12_17835 [Microbacterium sp. No. 7]
MLAELVVAAALALAPGGAPAGAAVPGEAPAAAAGTPSIVVDAVEAATGDRVAITLSGWPVGDIVSVSVCGDGTTSAHCATGSAIDLVPDATGAATTTILVVAPPAACPCAVVASGVRGARASAPLVVSDAPEPTPPAVPDDAPPPAPEPPPLTGRLSITGPEFWERQLALPSRRTLSVTVTNRSEHPTVATVLSVVLGRNERSGEVIGEIPLPALDPGAQATAGIEVTMPAGAFGRLVVHAADADGGTEIESLRLETWPILGAVGAGVLASLAFAIAQPRRFAQRLSLALLGSAATLGLVTAYVALA